MKRIFSLVALGALSACAVAAQTTVSTSGSTKAPADAQGSSTTASGSTSAKASTSSLANSKKGTSSVKIADGTKIYATLVSWLDAGRSRVGDPVQARIEQDVKQGGKVVLQKGTQLGGRVTVAQSRGNQGQSQVGVSFERALLPNGQSIPFHASIVALLAPQSASRTGAGVNGAVASGTAMGATPASARASGAAATGAAMNTSNAVASTASGTVNTAMQSSGAVGGPTSSGRLSPDSKGVFGLEGLSIGSAKSSAQGSTVVSTTKNVHLKSGTEMLLRTSTQAR
jgi:hypothetical protein